MAAIAIEMLHGIKIKALCLPSGTSIDTVAIRITEFVVERAHYGGEVQRTAAT